MRLHAIDCHHYGRDAWIRRIDHGYAKSSLAGFIRGRASAAREVGREDREDGRGEDRRKPRVTERHSRFSFMGLAERYAALSMFRPESNKYIHRFTESNFNTPAVRKLRPDSAENMEEYVW